ncbi:hypothetical protein ACQB60_41085 [Actinomycetota bacterium Odt1-20B]
MVNPLDPRSLIAELFEPTAREYLALIEAEGGAAAARARATPTQADAQAPQDELNALHKPADSTYELFHVYGWVAGIKETITTAWTTYGRADAAGVADVVHRPATAAQKESNKNKQNPDGHEVSDEGKVTGLVHRAESAAAAARHATQAKDEAGMQAPAAKDR